MKRAPERIETARLVLRRPRGEDAEAIFTRYMSDADVVRYLGRVRHTTVDQARQFLVTSDSDWERGPAGPFLIETRDSGVIVGSSRLRFPAPDVVWAGYAMARDAWGRGYATEALQAMVDLARALGFAELHASCHPDNLGSIRVMEKCGFLRDGVVAEIYPNLNPNTPVDSFRFVRRLGS